MTAPDSRENTPNPSGGSTVQTPKGMVFSIGRAPAKKETPAPAPTPAPAKPAASLGEKSSGKSPLDPPRRVG
ncbi:MAG: hypothetical protein HQL95_09185, partial [Magnetococcales bacterium]|nr:hypothetical protein [Magnetococcales bacterium]